MGNHITLNSRLDFTCGKRAAVQSESASGCGGDICSPQSESASRVWWGHLYSSELGRERGVVGKYELLIVLDLAGVGGDI